MPAVPRLSPLKTACCPHGETPSALTFRPSGLVSAEVMVVAPLSCGPSAPPGSMCAETTARLTSNSEEAPAGRSRPKPSYTTRMGCTAKGRAAEPKPSRGVSCGCWKNASTCATPASHALKASVASVASMFAKTTSTWW